MSKTILYIGWVGFGNQGDDLTFELFVDTASKKAKEQGLNVQIKGMYPASFDEFTLARLAPDVVVLGAGSLFEPVYLKPLVLANQAAIPTVIWGSGYDSLLESPLDASRIDPDSAFMIRQVVKNAAFIGVRGPYTLEMLEAIGATSPHLHVVGDPGLLLDHREDDALLPTLEKVKTPIVAVNWGTAGNNVLGGQEKAVADDLSEALRQLSHDLSIVIYPVWPRDLPACKDLYHSLDHPNCTLLDWVPSREELVALYTKSLFSVNMKLHANVFSAALGCPFLNLAYRMKGFDFASSLGWTEFVILFSEPDRKETMLRSMEKLQLNREQYQRRLQARKKDYVTQLAALTDQMLSLLI